VRGGELDPDIVTTAFLEVVQPKGPGRDEEAEGLPVSPGGPDLADGPKIAAP